MVVTNGVPVINGRITGSVIETGFPFTINGTVDVDFGADGPGSYNLGGFLNFTGSTPVTGQLFTDSQRIIPFYATISDI